MRTEKISAHRGTIVDRNGEPLAISTPVDSVWANPKELAPKIDSVVELARILELDSELLMRKITFSTDKEFLYLKRHLSPAKAREVMALNLPGVNIQLLLAGALLLTALAAWGERRPGALRGLWGLVAYCGMV